MPRYISVEVTGCIGMTATFSSPRRPRHTETSTGSTVTSPRDHRGNRAASPCMEAVWRRRIPQRVLKNVASGQRQTRSGRGKLKYIYIFSYLTDINTESWLMHKVTKTGTMCVSSSPKPSSNLSRTVDRSVLQLCGFCLPAFVFPRIHLLDVRARLTHSCEHMPPSR